jgi:Cu(I)/Ag(I) efflux system membrane protein CusA/SilA
MINSENGLLRGSVLMNVRGRDVGSFVAEAQRVVAQQVKLPSGYYIEWSGQYENQLSARRRLMLVIPAVFAIMSILLYKIYDSLKEALHVMLAVPFALTGGIFLYPRFSRSSWLR